MGEIIKAIENPYGVKVLKERPYYPGVFTQNWRFEELLDRIAVANKAANSSNDDITKGKTRVSGVYTLIRIGDLLRGKRFVEISEEQSDCLENLLDLLWDINSAYEMVGDFGHE